MATSTEMIKTLREATGAGVMDCKRALTESENDMSKATALLRRWGMEGAAKKAGRETREGTIASYIHTNNGVGRVGALVELSCETDFVARTEDFKDLVKDIAMHIAAASPQYLQREEVPQDIIDRETEIYKTQVQGKPEHVVEKIIQGKLEKFYEEICLLDQIFVKDPEGKKKIKDLITEKVAKVGENILVRRFTRYQLGETAK